MLDVNKYIRLYKLIKFYDIEHDKILFPQALYDNMDNLYNIFKGCTEVHSSNRYQCVVYYKDNIVLFAYRTYLNTIHISEHLVKQIFDIGLVIPILNDLYENKFNDKKIGSYAKFSENGKIY